MIRRVRCTQFFVIAAYIVVLGVAAFWLFMRKDIAGATGE